MILPEDEGKKEELIKAFGNLAEKLMEEYNYTPAEAEGLLKHRFVDSFKSQEELQLCLEQGKNDYTNPLIVEATCGIMSKSFILHLFDV